MCGCQVGKGWTVGPFSKGMSHLLKWIVKVTNIGAVSLVLSAAKWKGIVGLM